MPFTPAHAVVAIPFARTPLPAAAIAVGAMTPDVPLFFRVGIDYWLTHDWIGAVLVDLPLALMLLLVWRVVLRPAVPQLTPRWFAQRWPRGWSDPAAGWWETWGPRAATALERVRTVALLVLALLLGIATHLVWDAFTHEGRWGSDVVPALETVVGPFALVKWAQYASSAVGLAIIALWGLAVLRRADPVPPPRVAPAWVRGAVAVALPASLAIAGVVVAVIAGGPDATGWRIFLGRVGTTGAGLFLVILGLVAAAITLRAARHARDVT